MKSTTRRQNPKSTRTQTSKAGKARWLPSDNTRPTTFPDRRAVANRRACRGRVYAD